jgi:predicted N-acyltransferase
LLPDHFLTSLKNGKYEEMSPIFEIDPDMVLNIDPQWSSFQDYCDSIQSKYKKRVRKVLKDSSSVTVKKLNINEIEELMPKLKALYNNVHQKSSFSGPPLDVNSYLNFAKYSDIEFLLYGYFINDEIVAFSSEFCNEKNLYSYFIGLNYAQNKKYSLYNRILYDSIKHGINKKATKIIYGRTAAEFKSTIGAVPIKSKSAIYISNKILRLLFYPIAKNLSPKSWLQRNPFKGKANE